MSKIIINDYLSLNHAIDAFNYQVYKEKSSRCYKRRYGYYEKPSVLRRKRKKMKKILSQQGTMLQYLPYPNNSTFWLKVNLSQQFARSGNDAVGQ